MGSKKKTAAQTLKGFRDLDPQNTQRKKEVVDTIWQNALLAGFQPIETPILEYAETLLGTGNSETDKEVYLFEDHGKRQVGLRFDLTVPFSRYVAANLGTMVLPFKKFQVGNSYRGEKPQKGRYREFCQADFDIVGVDSLSADVEVLSQLAASLEAITPAAATYRVSHRVILSQLIRHHLPAVQASDEASVLIAIDKLLKVGPEKVVELICEIPDAEAAGANALLSLLTDRNSMGDTNLDAIRALAAENKVLLSELDRFEQTIKLVKDIVPQDRVSIKIDLSIARGLGYYTGIVFEANFDDEPRFGSISAGGRYNELVSRFSSQEVPGVGGSIGVDRLLAYSAKDNEISIERKGVFIAVAEDSARVYGFKILKQLRGQGFLADIDLKQAKLQAQFKTADRKNFAQVIVLGSAEVESNTVSLKNLATGDELKAIPEGDLSAHILP